MATRIYPRPAGRAGPPPGRGGFTLIELLVCVGIAGLLLALLVPAVIASRAAARTTQCRNNLKQIGLALQNFESVEGRYPSLSYDENVYRRLLPHLGGAALADRLDRGNLSGAANLSSFICPGDSWAAGRPDLLSTSYGLNVGDGRGKSGAFTFEGTGPASVRDGFSSSAAFAEIGSGDPALHLLRQLPLNPFETPVEAALELCGQESVEGAQQARLGYRGADWVTSGLVSVSYKHLAAPGSRSCVMTHPDDPKSLISLRSVLSAVGPHGDGVALCLLDGSVQYVSGGIELSTWAALGTVRGGEVVGDAF